MTFWDFLNKFTENVIAFLMLLFLSPLGWIGILTVAFVIKVVLDS